MDDGRRLHGDVEPGSKARPALRLLAIATSTPRCAVSVRASADGQAHEFTARTPPQPALSGHVLGLVDDVLRQATCPLEAIDAIAFDAGPGAFTGLRIGCGVAQGLGFALDRPLIPVGALQAIAWEARRQHAGHLALVAIDARMGELYCAAFDAHADLTRVSGVQVLAADAAIHLFEQALLTHGAAGPHGASGATQGGPAGGLRHGSADDAPAAVLLLGNGFDASPTLAEWAQRGGLPPPDVRAWADAPAIAGLGQAIWLDRGGIDPGLAAPMYVRDKVALDANEQLEARRHRAASAETRPAGGQP